MRVAAVLIAFSVPVLAPISGLAASIQMLDRNGHGDRSSITAISDEPANVSIEAVAAPSLNGQSSISTLGPVPRAVVTDEMANTRAKEVPAVDIPPDRRAVRVVGPAFYPAPEEAIDLRAPVRTPAP